MVNKKTIKGLIPTILWQKVANFVFRELPRQSLRAAVREQGLSELFRQLQTIVPDISRQYTGTTLTDPFYLDKVRSQHAFQIRLAQRAQQRLNKTEICIADIGDSAGTHIQYLSGLSGSQKLETLSVNLDAEAVAKIQAKGLKAVHCAAEELDQHQIHADILLSFEMIEHLIDPITFLAKMARSTSARYFVMTVPYVPYTRLGLQAIREGRPRPFGTEETHVYELCPADLRLAFSLAGWRVVEEQVYYQYPQRHWLRLLKGYWKRTDYEGFYGAILEKDLLWHDLYAWPGLN